jgi:LPS O-antigen subunit length determinant protein (WzzB/FepE family)
MKNNGVIIFLVLLVAIAFYFLGKKNGSANAKVTMIENVEMIKQIAELGALNVSGSMNLKVSNKGDEDGVWSKFKNYFAENTLQVNLPYDAKFGVNMSNQKMDVDTKAGLVTIYLPSCTLLSMQLKLDKMETMTQTGLFANASMDDLVKAQKELYSKALLQLENNAQYLKLAERHISTILGNYYKPLGYKVNCVFGKTPAQNPLP